MTEEPHNDNEPYFTPENNTVVNLLKTKLDKLSLSELKGVATWNCIVYSCQGHDEDGNTKAAVIACLLQSLPVWFDRENAVVKRKLNLAQTDEAQQFYFFAGLPKNTN